MQDTYLSDSERVSNKITAFLGYSGLIYSEIRFRINEIRNTNSKKNEILTIPEQCKTNTVQTKYKTLYLE